MTTSPYSIFNLITNEKGASKERLPRMDSHEKNTNYKCKFTVKYFVDLGQGEKLAGN